MESSLKAGHFTYQCRNFLKINPDKDIVLDISSTSSETEEEFMSPLTKLKGTDQGLLKNLILEVRVMLIQILVQVHTNTKKRNIKAIRRLTKKRNRRKGNEISKQKRGRTDMNYFHFSSSSIFTVAYVRKYSKKHVLEPFLYEIICLQLRFLLETHTKDLNVSSY
ncbi:protein SREK1IP1-like isoform X3 [Stegodyphus dumicola]|uniref:protein SREK1IP1-like isoform X3 n=1 Tax=Stegodyphus dumicola TaxID=202533 RepID=UPI0015AE9A15|nr:protein SREK1IP1-like isoform X3 [Stegodyphus dumicola]